jgi:hypothetical protein
MVKKDNEVILHSNKNLMNKIKESVKEIELDDAQYILPLLI